MTFVIVAVVIIVLLVRWYTRPDVTLTDWCDECGDKMVTTSDGKSDMAYAPNGSPTGVCKKCWEVIQEEIKKLPR